MWQGGHRGMPRQEEMAAGIQWNHFQTLAEESTQGMLSSPEPASGMICLGFHRNAVGKEPPFLGQQELLPCSSVSAGRSTESSVPGDSARASAQQGESS